MLHRSRLRSIPLVLAFLAAAAGYGDAPPQDEKPVAARFAAAEAMTLFGRYLADRFTAMLLLADQSADPEPLPKISTHEHYRVGGSATALLSAMDRLNIHKMVLVPTGTPPDNAGYRDHMARVLAIQREHPDRLIAYATVDESDPAAPDILKQAIADGARGLKLIGGHSQFYDAPIDSPIMHRLMAICRDANIPVLIHVDMGLSPQMHAEFERLLRAFPDLTFIAAHYGKFAPKLDPVREMLDQYPHLFLDLTMGGGVPRYLRQIDADPDEFRNFIIDYQDRLIWGADFILSSDKSEAFLLSRIGQDLQLFRRMVFASPWADYRVPLHALNLPVEVRRKIYWDNPWSILGERVLGSRAQAEARLGATEPGP